MNGWIFGCDICNEVCPWNQRFATLSTVADFAPRHAVDLDDPECFERLSQADFDTRFADTALARPGLDRMRRNVRAASTDPHAPLRRTGLAPAPGGAQPI
jgi:epoxyqueuosine reductase